MLVTQLKRGEWFRTMLSKRAGRLERIDKHGVRVYWLDEDREQTIHPNLVVVSVPAEEVESSAYSKAGF